jgi:TonB family protein
VRGDQRLGPDRIRARALASRDRIHKPSPSTMNAFLPKSMTKKPGHQAGEVVLKCKLHPDGTVSDCAVVDQTNPAAPFGEAALKASTLFRIKPRMANGTATDANWVLIPVSFDFDVTVKQNPREFGAPWLGD